MHYGQLGETVEGFVLHVFQSPDTVQYPYHNLAHTKAVVERAAEIGLFYSLPEMELCVLRIAAWFHDIGQLNGEMQDHEIRSTQVMTDYLHGISAPANIITAAAACIMATRYAARPATKLDKIICDADTYHFGTSYFQATDLLVKQEIELRNGRQYPHWQQSSLALLQHHVFYTEYCQQLLNEGKKENIRWLQSIIQQQG